MKTISQLQNLINQVYKEIWLRDDFGYFDIWGEITRENSGFKITEYFLSWKDPARTKHSRVLAEGITDIKKLESAFKLAITTDDWCYLTEDEYNKLVTKCK